MALFLSLGIGWKFVLFLKLGGGGRRYVRTHIPALLYTMLYHGYGSPLGRRWEVCANAHAYLIVYYTMVMVSPLLSRRYTFVDLNKERF